MQLIKEQEWQSLPEPAQQEVYDFFLFNIQQQDNNLNILDINLPHIYHLKILALHHNDPFDRLLLSQSHIENMPLISAVKS